MALVMEYCDAGNLSLAIGNGLFLRQLKPTTTSSGTTTATTTTTGGAGAAAGAAATSAAGKCVCVGEGGHGAEGNQRVIR